MPVFLLKFATGIFGEKFAKVGAWAMVLVVAGLLIFVVIPAAWDAFKGGIVEDARTEENAKAVEDKAAADTNAAAARAEQTVRAAQEQGEIEEAIDEARSEGRDARAAYYECVKLLQSARAAGRPTPSC